MNYTFYLVFTIALICIMFLYHHRKSRRTINPKEIDRFIQLYSSRPPAQSDDDFQEGLIRFHLTDGRTITYYPKLGLTLIAKRISKSGRPSKESNYE
jgi:hypothetical protein